MLAWYTVYNYKKKSKKAQLYAVPKKAIMKKDAKSKVVAKKWLDGKLMEKNLIMTIQVNFVPNPSETWRGFTWIIVIKIFATITAISWPPLWISHLFSQWSQTFFYSWAVLDYVDIMQNIE